MERYHATSVQSRNSAASTARSATQNGAIDHPQPGADKVDSALPVVRAEAAPTPNARSRLRSLSSLGMFAGSTADVALFYGLAIGTSAKCADGQGWRH